MASSATAPALLRAFAAARVPKLTVVLRKAYGGAVITMNSKDLGADIVFAWPGAEIGIMAARQAVGIVERRALDGGRGRRGGGQRARPRVRRGAPRSGAGRGFGLRRRGDRARLDPRPSRMGAGRAGAPMSRLEPNARIAAEFSSQACANTLSLYVALGDSFTAGSGCWPRRGLAGAARRPPASEAARSSSCATSRFTERPAPRWSSSSPRRSSSSPTWSRSYSAPTTCCRTTRPDPTAYAHRLDRILRTLQEANPVVRIVTATSPERWEFLGLGPRTGARISRGIAAINRATRSAAAANGVACLDVVGHPGLSEPENFSADGLHPSPLGHRRAARAFAALVEESFGIEIATEGGADE